MNEPRVLKKVCKATDERDAEILRLRSARWAVRDIAKRMGLSYRTTQYAINGRVYRNPEPEREPEERPSNNERYRDNGRRWAVMGNGPARGTYIPLGAGEIPRTLKVKGEGVRHWYSYKRLLNVSECEYLYDGTTTCAQR